MSSSTPFISVITTVYNAAEYIEAAISSILKQTYSNFEYIIIDDGSDDNTIEIIEQINDDRIKLIKIGRLGRAKALCEAVKQCSGKYIANMDADDLSIPERLESQVIYMEANPLLGVLGSAYYQLYSNDRIVLRKYPENNKSLRSAMALYGPFCHSSVMYREEAIEKSGGFSSSSNHRIDYELWIKIAAAGFHLANLSTPLVSHKKSDDTYFSRTFSEWKLSRNMIALNFRAIKLLGLSKLYYIPATIRFFWRFLPKQSRKFLVGFFSKIDEKPVVNQVGISQDKTPNDMKRGGM